MQRAPSENLEELILEQKKLVAESYLLELWEDAVNDGIEADIVARVLIRGSLLELARKHGEQEALSVIHELTELEADGNFLPLKTIQ